MKMLKRMAIIALLTATGASFAMDLQTIERKIGAIERELAGLGDLAKYDTDLQGQLRTLKEQRATMAQAQKNEAATPLERVKMRKIDILKKLKALEDDIEYVEKNRGLVGSFDFNNYYKSKAAAEKELKDINSEIKKLDIDNDQV